MEQIKNIVDNFIKKTGIDAEAEADFIFENWEKIAGKEFKKGTKPFKYSHNKLFIYADNSVILSEIRYKKKDIINNINAVFKEEKVKDIIFRIKK
ncbi:MAG: DUF721 domain-containing protein [Candidatus Goldiibacteriota bacterium]